MGDRRRIVMMRARPVSHKGAGVVAHRLICRDNVLAKTGNIESVRFGWMAAPLLADCG
ncbi:MAG: hypothetical protein U9N36_06170 [Euryarchaeota archaeon]|nr:hypothetical protein [Euryarchaeota archaeon]